MSTGLLMMLKSLGIDPKMLEGVAKAVQSAAHDLKTIREQNEEILLRLRVLTPEVKPVPQLELVKNGG